MNKFQFGLGTYESLKKFMLSSVVVPAMVTTGLFSWIINDTDFVYRDPKGASVEFSSKSNFVEVIKEIRQISKSK